MYLGELCVLILLLLFPVFCPMIVLSLGLSEDNIDIIGTSSLVAFLSHDHSKSEPEAP